VRITCYTGPGTRARMVTLTRFASFELCSRARELRKHGIRIRIPDQSFEILLMLVERRGEVVTRDEIRRRLWPDGTVVDFDTGMNSAVKRLRDALGDTASSPRFIETLPRRGYRLLVPVEAVEAPVAASAATTQRPGATRPRKWLPAAVSLLVLVSAASMAPRWGERGKSQPIRAIAVLPLVPAGAAQEYLADGILDEVIAAVSQLQAIRVISMP
jgi:DNA-binding winged helix-turn-helix (wHTH) protein